MRPPRPALFFPKGFAPPICAGLPYPPPTGSRKCVGSATLLPPRCTGDPYTIRRIHYRQVEELVREPLHGFHAVHVVEARRHRARGLYFALYGIFFFHEQIYHLSQNQNRRQSLPPVIHVKMLTAPSAPRSVPYSRSPAGRSSPRSLRARCCAPAACRPHTSPPCPRLPS